MYKQIKKTDTVRIKIKEALADYNSQHNTNISIGEFALLVYKNRKIRKASKAQRMANIQNPDSGYSVTLKEATRIAEVLNIDLNTLNEKYVEDATARKRKEPKEVFAGI